MNCAACSNDIADDSLFCSYCGQSTSAPSAEATRERTPSDVPSSPLSGVPRGRFPPGKILAGRFRIVEQVGKGGMGEVYHADDLMLDQPVALKFLPEELSRDRDSLKRFRDEVRMARQISHPNVCRVYDIGEVEGLHFLSMEYIHGEDLRSLLRRIGRLPPDKALEIAGQLASGLAAAHDKGVLHRDMKPANVMIDDRGHARITDFGLAVATEDVETRDIRSGTPGYMAPEQRAGKEVTERSDIFSLGLVLYELFTGKRAFAAVAGEDTTPSGRERTLERPGSLVDDLDPAVERVILQCLEMDPRARPPSAVAVRAALPGGNALDAAVARGETPAPALVADAGEVTGLSPTVAWICLCSVVVTLAGAIWMAGQSRLTQIVPLPKSPDVLIADARAILERLGHPAPLRDHTFGFIKKDDYIDHLASTERSRKWWDLLARGEPSVIRFWYRQSPRYLVPHRITEFFSAEYDPPNTIPGMVSLELDPRGRLRQLEVVPIDPGDSADDSYEVSWDGLFDAAGFDIDDFAPAEPQVLPPTYSDQRAAWDGAYPDAPEIPIRLEAAAFRGRIVAFRVVEPWTEPEAIGSTWLQASDIVSSTWARLAHIGFQLLFMLALSLLAWRNLKRGRGDRRLAFRLACLLFAIVMMQWLWGAHHVPERSQLQVFFGGLYRAFFAAGMAWLFYIALEPYARRLWPRTMVSWIRMLDGRFRDPLVGRDVLLGCVYGIGFAFIFQAPRLASVWLGGVPPRPDIPRHPAELIALGGVSESLAELFAVQANIATHVLYLFVALLILRFIFRRTWLAVGVHGTLYCLMYFSVWPMGFLTVPLWSVLWYVFFFRFGWVSILVATLVTDLLSGYPLTADLSRWYAHSTVLVALFCLALAVYGFKMSLGGRPLFKDLLADG